MIRKATMLKAIIVFVAVCGFSFVSLSSAQAQERDEWIKPITSQGSAAFMLSIEGLGTFNVSGPGMIGVPVPSTLGTFPTSSTTQSLPGFGVKYFVADDLGLRLLLGFNHTSMKSTDTSESPSSGNRINGQTMWGIGLGAEHHFRPLYSVTPYVGLQVMFASSATDEPTNADISYSGSNLGVGLFAGFDWFVARGIALGAEGGLTWESWSLTQTGKSTEIKGPVGSSIMLAMNGLVHAVVYF